MQRTTEDIKDMLEDESSLGLAFADNLFIGREPTSPNNCVTIFDTPGSGPDLNYDASIKYDYPSVQIRVRNTSYPNAADLAQDIKATLHNRAQETWSGAVYTLIQCTSEPALLDWDENDRARFVINFDIQRQPT